MYETVLTGTTAIYVRTAKADDEACAAQRLTLDSFVSEHNIENLRYYEDNGYSNDDYTRPALLEMEQDIRDGKINQVIMLKFGSIVHHPAVLLKWLLGLQRYKVQVCFIESDSSWDSLDPVFNQIKGLEKEMAPYEN